MGKDHLTFALNPQFIERYKPIQPVWGFPCGGGNTLGELTNFTKYSRLKEDGSKETWVDQCQRVTEGTFTILKNHCDQVRTKWNHMKAARAAEDFFDRMFNFKWLPPGRGLWMMGTPFIFEVSSAGLQNCAFLSSETLGPRNPTLPFTRLMEMSMLGIGVGFDTKGSGKLVIYEPDSQSTSINFVIEDSREGWIDSLDLLLRSYFLPNGRCINFDYSKIRLEGSPIKRFGGISSGPGPLIKLHSSIKELFKNRNETPLTGTDIVDLMNLVGKCVVAGNVRRSAELALGSANDEAFLNLKNPVVNPVRMGNDGWGFMSNNTVIAKTGDDYSHLVDRISDNGEPGLFYLDIARDYGRLADPPTGRDYRVMGINPCVSARTIVQTTEGPRTALSLLNKPFWAVIDGKVFRSKTGMFVTGTKPLFRLSTIEGYELEITADHKIKTNRGMIPANQLIKSDRLVINNHRDMNMTWPGNGSQIDGYLLGCFIGDGGWENKAAVVKVWEKDVGCESMKEPLLVGAISSHKRRSNSEGWRDHERGYKIMTVHPEFLESWGNIRRTKILDTEKIETSSSDFHIGFIRGLFDTDGTVQDSNLDKGLSLSLTQTSYKRLQLLQRMLLRFGIKSTIYDGRPESDAALSGGIYHCQATYRLVISTKNVKYYSDIIGFNHAEKRRKLSEALNKVSFYEEPFTVSFKQLTLIGEEIVYDCTVDELHLFDANGFVVSNCAEQNLENNECCTLVESFPYNHANLEDFKRTLKWAYLYAKSVTLLPTHWAETNEVMGRNRRIGTSVSGIVQFAEQRGWTELKRWMDESYEEINERDTQYSEWLGVRESIKKTSVKPSGTVSLVAGATPGVHWPEESTYIRRQRFRVNDPLVQGFDEAGYKIEADVMDPTYTVVVEFPTQGPKVRSNREVSVWEKVALASLMQKYWSDNAVSATFTFRPDEKDQIGPLLRAFDGQLKSISFLPLLEGGAYAQMPYEAITEEEFVKKTENIKRINFNSANDAEGERYCTTDYCER